MLIQILEINGQKYEVFHTPSVNKNAVIRLKGKALHVSTPHRWPSATREKIYRELTEKARRSIEKGKWKLHEHKELDFHNLQIVKCVAGEFPIVVIRDDGTKGAVKLFEGRILLRMSNSADKDVANQLIRKVLCRIFAGWLEGRVAETNLLHFNSKVGKISVRNNKGLWGSCTRRENRLSFNLRLAFLPQYITDYVIVHELAHTKEHNHSAQFWAHVERVLPDYKERKKWLRENGHDADVR